MVATSRYSGEIQAAFHVGDTARFFKCMLYGILFGNENIATVAMIRNDCPEVVGNVHPINSAAKERMPNGFLESNRGDGANPCLALSHIMDPLNISDEMAKTTTQNKLILLLSRNIRNR